MDDAAGRAVDDAAGRKAVDGASDNVADNTDTSSHRCVVHPSRGGRRAVDDAAGRAVDDAAGRRAVDAASDNVADNTGTLSYRYVVHPLQTGNILSHNLFIIPFTLSYRASVADKEQTKSSRQDAPQTNRAADDKVGNASDDAARVAK